MIAESGGKTPKEPAVGAVAEACPARKNFAKSAGRALDVLCYMAECQRPARAREIARELGLAASSTDQLLKTMVAAGYLVFRFTDKTYFPAPKLGHFARWLTAVYPSQAQVEDLLEELHHATGQVVLFSVESDCFMEVQNCVHGDIDTSERSGWQVRPGWKVPILESAIGGAVLAGRSNSDIRRVFERSRRLRSIDEAALADGMAPVIWSVNEFRRLGYAWRMRSQGPRARPSPGGDVMSIAVGLRCTGFGSGMVLGLAGPEQEVGVRRDQFAGMMHHLAAKYGLAAA